MTISTRKERQKEELRGKDPAGSKRIVYEEGV